ncbi:MAG: hypothetical protein EAZ97_02275 [Bacteroidetes bacterium]|nr:MAG: hypothetical protein EAZ97_02275 [Bacteroidota bacterium]
MSYRSFTFSDLKKKFGIKQSEKRLFLDETPQIQASAWLIETLNIGKKNRLISEKSVGENLISPILTEIKLKNIETIELYSGANLSADKLKGLNGECDFLYTFSPQSVEINSPIISITEAKKGDITDLHSLAQCSAQLLGARIFNEKEGKSTPILYGCVSSGHEWLFLKLEKNTIFIDTERYYIKNLPELLGILQHIVDFYKD